MKVIPPTQAVVRSLLASLQQLLLIHCVCVISPHVLHHCHPFISAALRSALVLSTLFTHHSFISVGPSVASSSLVKKYIFPLEVSALRFLKHRSSGIHSTSHSSDNHIFIVTLDLKYSVTEF